MSLEIKKLKIDVSYHKISDGVVEEIKIVNDIYRLVHPEEEKETIPEKKPEEKKKTRKYKKRSKGGKKIGYDKAYGINIFRNEVNRVLTSLRSGNNETALISKDTKLKTYRTQGTLHWLKSEGIISQKIGKNRATYYEIVDNEWKP